MQKEHSLKPPSTNDNSSVGKQHQAEKLSYSNSEGFFDDYVDRRELTQEESKECLPKFENLNV